ncbi:MAG: hypothetical protein QOH71_4120 [Blastocatellia bacterium]|jgi:hypothetical protein|nr:hypothetical protein [Blastocatellia bacterium]
MKILKNLSASLLLTSVLTISAFGGETQTPPCAQGETQTPPCAVAPGDIDTPGFTSTAPASLATPRVESGRAAFAELAADILLNFLPLY